MSMRSMLGMVEFMTNNKGADVIKAEVRKLVLVCQRAQFALWDAMHKWCLHADQAVMRLSCSAPSVTLR